MCNIFAYLSNHEGMSLSEILSLLVSVLKRQESNGYDSCGVSFDIPASDETNGKESRKIMIIKTKGDVENIIDIIEKYKRSDIVFDDQVVMSHTRWATQGISCGANAHPHYSSPKMEFVVIHNGIITNFDEIKRRIINETSSIKLNGKISDDVKVVAMQSDEDCNEFTSDTDTEVIPKLALIIYKKLLANNGTKPTFVEVVKKTMELLQGTFGVVFKSSLFPNEIVATKLSSPLYLGLKYKDKEDAAHTVKFLNVTNHENEFGTKLSTPCGVIISSSRESFNDLTESFIVLKDWDIVHVTPGYLDIINTRESCSETRAIEDLPCQKDNVVLNGYSNFMEMEIFEQPSTLKKSISGRITKDHKINFGGIKPFLPIIKKAQAIGIIAVASSYNAALAVRPLFEQYINQRVFVEIASDFNDRKPAVFRDDVFIFISQSGETSDTLNALKYCKEKGAFCIGICNTPGSRLSVFTECGIFINAGPEIGLVSTKSYTSNIAMLTLFLLLMLDDNASFQKVKEEAINDIINLPTIVQTTLKIAPQIQKIAPIIASQKSIIVLGRRIHYATARETALKINELTYIHTEGLMAGELKHGPLALIDENAFVIFFATGEDKEMVSACSSSLQQVKTRGAKILVVATEQEIPIVSAFSEFLIEVPKTTQWIQTIINIIPMQLLAYYVAMEKNINVERPRNILKTFSFI